MDLQVASVQSVVVEDHHRGEFDVLVLERLEHAIELFEDHVDPAESGPLSSFSSSWKCRRPSPVDMPPYPNFPVTYSSVRLSPGLEKILSVAACSIISPASMNAVVSATRAACCMSCVTMTIV